MRITLAVIGRVRTSPESELIARYRKQLSWQLDIKEFEAKKGLTGQARIQAEADWLLQTTESCHKKRALDERGQALSSIAFAQHIEAWQNDGCSHLGIIIGGADGLAPEVRQHAALILSFGKLTWPHMLARAMLCEQLYRAQSILRNHPYHRE